MYTVYLTQNLGGVPSRTSCVRLGVMAGYQERRLSIVDIGVKHLGCRFVDLGIGNVTG